MKRELVSAEDIVTLMTTKLREYEGCKDAKCWALWPVSRTKQGATGRTMKEYVLTPVVAPRKRLVLLR